MKRFPSRCDVYEVRPRKDKRGVDLISDVLPFGRLFNGKPNAIGNAIGYAEDCSRSHDTVIRLYDAAGNVYSPALNGRGLARGCSAIFFYFSGRGPARRLCLSK